jgi:hypothetical protein
MVAAVLATVVVGGIVIGHGAGAAPRTRATTSAGPASTPWIFVSGAIPHEHRRRGVPKQLKTTIPSVGVFLEADVALPGGALVSRVTYFYRDCGHSDSEANNGHWYFFEYDPAGGGGQYLLPIQSSPKRRCAVTTSFVRTISPAVRIEATKTYAVGDRSDWVEPAGDTDPQLHPGLLVAGARITYTCPNGC